MAALAPSPVPRRFSTAKWARSILQIPETRNAMLVGEPQFLCHQTDRNAKAGGYFLSRQAVEAPSQQDGTAARRKFSEHRLECLQIGARLQNLFGIGRLVGQIEQAVDLDGCQMAFVGTALV